MPLLLFILLWVFTCIGAEYPNELVLQHIPTAIVVVGLFLARRRRWLSPASESLVLLFMTLHLLGKATVGTHKKTWRWPRPARSSAWRR